VVIFKQRSKDAEPSDQSIPQQVSGIESLDWHRGFSFSDYITPVKPCWQPDLFLGKVGVESNFACRDMDRARPFLPPKGDLYRMLPRRKGDV
jgi:hypothetical protein